MNRRHFLSAITAAVGAFAIDPERALWVPGKKTISVPTFGAISVSDIITQAYRDLGVLLPGERVSFSARRVALVEANKMLGNWSHFDLAVRLAPQYPRHFTVN